MPPDAHANLVTVRQAADSLINSVWRDSDIFKGEALQTLRALIEKKTIDFYCVLKYRRTYEQLWAEGDEGVLKLAKLLKVDATGEFSDRYQRAFAEGDTDFMRQYQDRLARQCTIDRRVLNNTPRLAAKKFLFFNWVMPLLTPKLVLGLLVRSDPRICGLLSQLEYPVDWDEDRLKQERHKLGLKRTPTLRHLAEVPISVFAG